MIVESGVSKVADGSMVEAGHVRDVTGTLTDVSFDHEFTNAPTVIVTITSPGDKTYVVRTDSVTTTGFSVII
jgi:hypothetical protein